MNTRGIIYKCKFLHCLCLLLLVHFFFFQNKVTAATCTTLGLSTVYTSPLAWSCGRVPTAFIPGPDDLEIIHDILKVGDLTYTNIQKVTISQNADFVVQGDLIITNGAVLKLESGTLHVTGDLIIANGSHLNLTGGTLKVDGKLIGSGSGGFVTVASGVNVDVDGSVEMTASNSLFLNNGSVTSTGLVVKGSITQLVNNGTLYVDGDTEVEALLENNGDLNVTGDLIIKGTGVAYSSGTLTVGRDLIVQGAAKLFLIGGDATIGRDFINFGNVEVLIDGTLSAGRNITNSGSSYICGDGILAWEQTLSTSGSSSFCNGVEPYSSPWNLSTSSPAVTLPVKLSSFTAKPTDRGNEIAWVSVSEEDFSHYELEKSQSSDNFKKLISIQGKGGLEMIAKYSYIDAKALGICYYRLRSVDLDGSEEFSAIVQVQNAFEMKPKIYPTSISQNYFNVENLPAGGTLHMHCANGKPVNLEHSAGSQNSYYFSNARPGVYIITVRSDTNAWNKRVLVVN